MSRTVDRAIEILDIISQSENGLSLSDIVQITGYPKTSVYDILRSLENRSMIYKRDCPASVFSIGFRAFAIGNTYCSSSHLLENANEELIKLGEKYKKAVLLGKPYRNSSLYVGKYQPKESLLRLPEIGEKEDFDKNAMGKLFSSMTTLSCKKGIEKCKQEYVIQGNSEESLVYSIAAPIYNFEKRLSGAIMLIDIYKANIDVESEILDVIKYSEIISEKMGYVK